MCRRVLFLEVAANGIADGFTKLGHSFCLSENGGLQRARLEASVQTVDDFENNFAGCHFAIVTLRPPVQEVAVL